MYILMFLKIFFKRYLNFNFFLNSFKKTIYNKNALPRKNCFLRYQFVFKLKVQLFM